MTDTGSSNLFADSTGDRADGTGSPRSTVARPIYAARDLAIDVADVHKTYRGKIKALRGVHLRVPRGEIFGLLGPNGAGKSTLVKVLMTVINADRASGHMLGQPIGDKPTLARVGYLPEHHRFPDYLTAEQVIHFFGTMSGVDRITRRRRVPELIELVGLAGARGKKVRQYSKGMRQRLGLAQALINDPEVLLLDEPTDGVDPEGRRDIRTLLLELRARQKAIVINTHILAELELVCDRAAIIYDGQLHDEGTMAQLTSFDLSYLVEALPPLAAGLSGPAAEVALDALLLPQTVAGGPSEQMGKAIARRADSAASTPGATQVRVSSTAPDDVQPVIDRLRHAGWRITRVHCQRPTLEDAFMRVIDRAKGGEPPMIQQAGGDSGVVSPSVEARAADARLADSAHAGTGTLPTIGGTQ